MSILDTFYILFESNADAVKKGADDATAAGKKLQEELNKTGGHGEEAANKIKHANEGVAASFHHVLEAADEMTKGVVEKVAEIAAAFMALLGVEKLVENFFEQAHHTALLGEQARSLGVNVETLDAWGQAVKRVHGSSDGFIQSLMTLGTNLERVDLGAGARSRKFFEEMGINIRGANGAVKSGFDLLPELNKKFQDYTPAKALALGRGIGLDEGTIRLLQLSTHEFDEIIKRTKELGVITKEDTEAAHHFNIAWLDVQQIMRSITIHADTAFLPMITKILHYVEEFILFMKEHADFAEGLAIGIGVALAIVTRGFWLLNAALWANPYFLIALGIIALIVLFALLYDDIKNFAEGHNSLLGEMIKKWPLLGKAVEGFISVLKMIKPVIDEISHFFDWVFDKIMQGFRDIGTIGEATFLFMRDLVSDPTNAVSNFNARMKSVNLLGHGDNTSGGDANAPRGLRNNNPLNLEYLPGQGASGSDGRFGVYPTMQAGIEASARQLLRYQDHYGLKTINGIIGRWAPAGENNVNAYAGSVSKSMGIDANSQIDLHDPKVMTALIKAMGQVENGRPLPDFTLDVAPKKFDSLQQLREQMLKDTTIGKQSLNATHSPLMAQTSNSIASSLVKNNLLNTGGITINAPNSNPEILSETFLRHLQEHYESVMPNYADGVSH